MPHEPSHARRNQSKRPKRGRNGAQQVRPDYQCKRNLIAAVEAGQVDEVVKILALACHLPVALVGRSFRIRNIGEIVVFAKAASLPWQRLAALLARLEVRTDEIASHSRWYARLTVGTAIATLRFYRLGRVNVSTQEQHCV